MPSCECCWEAAARRALSAQVDMSEVYAQVLREHEERGCPCTKPGPEGDRLRAGQFWQDGRDTRKTPPGEASAAAPDFRELGEAPNVTETLPGGEE